MAAPSVSDPTAVSGPAARDEPATSFSPEWLAQLGDLRVAVKGVFRSFIRLRGRDTHLGGSELGHAQFELLLELGERGELAAGELAAAARLAPATVTQMLDHLAECGHVERVRSERDRRLVVSRLTPQGEAKLEQKRKAWRALWEDALEGVPVEDLRAATRVLELLGSRLEDAPERRFPSPSAPTGAEPAALPAEP